MQIYRNPGRDEWPTLLRRPQADYTNLYEQVQPILNRVQQEGDEALRHFTRRFDQIDISDLCVTETELSQAAEHLNPRLKEAINRARANVERFHKHQMTQIREIETETGVTCWQKETPIEKVGLYVPGGSAPLFSTVLMLAVPAAIAGCRQIVLCSPPGSDGGIHPAILYAAHQSGITSVFRVGGAQAVAAMAYGTESIPAVYKIFGPGNAYVTVAKQLLSLEDVAIDLPAGPSEVAVLADQFADPAFVAMDLLSQAEHGPDSQVIFATDDDTLLQRVLTEVEQRLQSLPRKEIAREALQHSKSILLPDLESAMDLLNQYAPEHLILNVKYAERWTEKVTNAGSVFVGSYTPESAGDYASGTNHTLPTGGYARNYSGLTLASFMKTITFQRITREGLDQLGPVIETMAEHEGLEAHRQAVAVRRERKLNGKKLK